MKVTVFGGSTPKAGERAYEDALELGHQLARAGHTVFTGGYSGTMEAVSRGAAEAGGHTVGITCEEIDAFRPGGPNQWVLEERKYKSLKARMYALIEACEAAMALPGGIGTAAEITAMWSQLQVGAIPKSPLILIGTEWKTIFAALLHEQAEYIPHEHQALIHFAADVREAVALLADS